MRSFENSIFSRRGSEGSNGAPRKIKFRVGFADTKCDISYGSKAFLDSMPLSNSSVLFGPYCEYALAQVARLIKVKIHRQYLENS